ncbi:Probable trehalose-phosphate phosphatase J [Linum perenne]
MRDTVRRLAQRFKTSIVSGRCVDKVRTFVKLPELYYAGSHGLDIEGPGDVYQHAPEFLKLMTAVFNDLTKKTQSIPGCRVENNKISVSTHYRCVEDGNEENVKGLVDSVLNEHHDELRLVNGKKVFEIRPKIDWNKGNAVEFLLQSLGEFSIFSNIIFLIEPTLFPLGINITGYFARLLASYYPLYYKDIYM